MIGEEEARAQILARVRPLPPRRVPLLEAVGYFAAEERRAQVALPGFDNSAMDGYAVRAADTAPGARLRVIGEQPAGRDRKLTVCAGEAARIFTGAPLPAGADAVVMQEETTTEGDVVVLQTTAEAGEFVRRQGGDLAEGQRLFAPGTEISAPLVGLLASQGWDTVAVGGRPRVALLSTGDELAPAGAALAPGQIYESNSLMLAALVQQAGAEVASRVHARDERGAIGESLRAAVAADVVIVSGGVSVGAHDLVKSALTELGAQP